VTTTVYVHVSIHVSDAIAVALIGAGSVIIAALMTSLATVIGAWLQSRHRGPS
jgi:hypothetical protein